MTPERLAPLAVAIGVTGLLGAWLLSDLPPVWRAVWGVTCALGAIGTRSWVGRARGPAVAATLLLALAAWLSFLPD